MKRKVIRVKMEEGVEREGVEVIVEEREGEEMIVEIGMIEGGDMIGIREEIHMKETDIEMIGIGEEEIIIEDSL